MATILSMTNVVWFKCIKHYLWIDEISVFKDGINAVSIADDSHLKQGWCDELLLPSVLDTQHDHDMTSGHVVE